MPLLERKKQRDKWFDSDVDFNQLYPPAIQALSKKQWTPISIARKAANFLAAENNASILDIGSGVGKFCLAAAYYKPKSFFYGVEQRRSLTQFAEMAKDVLNLDNVSFSSGNFTQIDFGHYDHFYFYNSFYENLAGTEKIDDSIDYSRELFNYYNRYLFKQLQLKPAGTRLATFHSLEDEIPWNYHIVGTEADNLLKFWIKI